MKAISRVLSSAGLLVLTAILVAAAKKMPLAFLGWYPGFSGKVLDVIGNVTSVFPFPLWEVLAVLLLVWLLVSLIKSLPHGRILRWAAGVLLAASVGVFLFVGLWGLNHFLPTKTSQIVQVQEASVQSLQAAALHYGKKAGELADTVARDDDGRPDLGDYLALAGDGFQGQPALTLPKKAPLEVKKLFAGKVFSYLGTTGIFVPYTAEACINPDTYPASLPYVACHELAHRTGAASEEDANFVAFLTASANPDPRYQYSAYYSAFLYCFNALQELAPEAAQQVWASCTEQLRADLDGAGAHYAPYEGKVQDVAKTVNDAYLKAFDEAGVKSYDLVANALVAWYEKNS